MSYPLNWTYLQSFLAIAETGSLSAAARKMKASQPTMGRHLNQLEEMLGVKLFIRHPDGLALNDTGLKLIDKTRDMAAAASNISIIATGETKELSGSVRITACEALSVYMLPDFLLELAQIQPDIDVELVASDTEENLLRHDADIAIRMYQPKQLDLISRKLADVPLGLYCSYDYIDKHGKPGNLQELMGQRFIGFDRSDVIIRSFQQRGIKIDRNFFKFRSDNQVVGWEMVKAGYGLGFMPVPVGQKTPNVIRIDQDLQMGLPQLELWLVSHAELKTSRRIRYVFDFLADQLIAAA